MNQGTPFPVTFPTIYTRQNFIHSFKPDLKLAPHPPSWSQHNPSLRNVSLQDLTLATTAYPLTRVFDHGRSHRIEHDIARKLQEIGVPLHVNRFVTALEKMPA